jgi:hypothetical protein
MLCSRVAHAADNFSSRLPRLRSLFAKWTISEMARKKQEDPELFGKTAAGMNGAGSQNYTVRAAKVSLMAVA